MIADTSRAKQAAAAKRARKRVKPEVLLMIAGVVVLMAFVIAFICIEIFLVPESTVMRDPTLLLPEWFRNLCGL